jgi:hypothetical protein
MCRHLDNDLIQNMDLNVGKIDPKIDYLVNIYNKIVVLFVYIGLHLDTDLDYMLLSMNLLFYKLIIYSVFYVLIE